MQQDCFLCRVMRSFAITGLGALLGVLLAWLLDLPAEQMAWLAIAGGLSALFAVQAYGARGARRRDGGG